MSKLTNAKAMIQKAAKEGYAIAHINTNNLEWTRAILIAAQEANSPVIIATSEGAVKYIGGYKNVYNMVNDAVDSLNITVPVALHLDHGSYDGVFKALEAGFTSVMFDGSHLPFKENYEKSIKVIEAAKKYNASVELEVGTIGGEEDGVVGNGELANPEECKKMQDLGCDMLAAGIGNIHGIYPASWKSLNFEVLQSLKQASGASLVLHGGSGIPDEQVKKAISLGVAKVNVNTECQLAFAAATRKYILEEKDLDEAKKGYDPRKLLKPGFEAIKAKCIEKINLFGSNNKA
ncbi:class II fructose-1,6-bisphosphate aldolase [Mycoplasma bradburyae]|uniref:Class II fructose-1,6-bisphosphate aldolase n=1 Tax=Mycoplasma bradburyae TaxID=2963128 RepID=A0AAW6HPB7_9MOLU|nr:class II fructose-1,6-bisphosphate aldolase [Mycoplasma bradburyae]MDC4183159.1 class II fructose-1,6-bisphosphate aldolase [Mycoplasma bradburyae]